MATEKSKNEKDNKKKKMAWWKKGLIPAAVLLALVAGVCAYISKTPRARLLISTVRFASETLDNPSYLLYDVDIMDLCQNYANADTLIRGTAHLSNVKNFGYSITMDLTARRSFPQKKLAAQADLTVLSMDVGSFTAYARNQMVYLIVPMLDDLSYAFDTDMNLFFKAPEFTHDIDREWFTDNWQNILEFSGQIEIEDTADTIDDDGRISKGYMVTIPQGCGDFIWELIGLDKPDHDIVLELYLTPGCHLRRMVFTIDKQSDDATIEEASVTIDGTDVGQMILEVQLPDQEILTVNITRNGDYKSTNLAEVDAVYYANTKETYSATMEMAWTDRQDGNGADLSVSNILVQQGEETLMKASFRGSLTKDAFDYDLTEGAPVDLNSIEVIEWKQIRNDTEGFFSDVIDEIKSRI